MAIKQRIVGHASLAVLITTAWSSLIFTCVTRGWWLVATDPSRRFEDLFERFSDGSILLHGGDLYALRPQLNNTNPPFVTLAYLPLRMLGHSGGAYLMTLISTLCVAGVVAIGLQRVVGIDAARAMLLAAVVGVPAALLMSYPLQVMFREGQIRAVILLAVAADILVVPRRWTGILIGVTAGLTLTPLAFVIIVWLRDGRGPVLRSLVAMAGTMVLGLLAGIHASAHFWFSMLPSGRQVDLVVANLATVARSTPDFGLRSNASLLAALSRPPVSDAIGMGAAKAIALGLGILAIIPVFFAVRVMVRERLDVSAIVVVAVVTLVFSPVSWEHYWVWSLLCPFVIIEVWNRGPLRALAWGAVALFAACCTDSLGVNYRAATGHFGAVVLIPVRNLYVTAGLLFLVSAVLASWRFQHQRPIQTAVAV